MAALYEITAAILPLRHALDLAPIDEDGVAVVAPDLLTLLDQIEGDYAAKLDACARVVRSLESEADMVSQEADRLDRRAKSLLGNAERLKEAMRSSLVATGTQSVRTALFTVSLRKGSTHVEVSDPDALPAEFTVYVPAVRRPDKAEIAKALKAGHDVPGASLATGEPTLSIR